jgi:hypothetical protein
VYKQRIHQLALAQERGTPTEVSLQQRVLLRQYRNRYEELLPALRVVHPADLPPKKDVREPVA